MDPFRRLLYRLARRFDSLPVKNGYLALVFVLSAVAMAGLESAYVQTVTAYRRFSPDLLFTPSFLFLLCLDLLVPLTVALLSRRFLFVYFAIQCFLSTVLLHYTIFFYNPLTLSSIYHSMQGAASLGLDIFGFARWDIIAVMGALFAFKALLVQLGRTPDWGMPRFWGLRGITAVACMAVIWLISSSIYGRTGLSMLWVDSRGHRTATERRMEEGTREAVRTIGYLGTWIGEWLSGTYRDTALIYAERGCADPDEAYCRANPQAALSARWSGLPVPFAEPPRNRVPGEDQAGLAEASSAPQTIVFIQVESLDYAVLGMRVNNTPVTPFLNGLAEKSLTLKAFAPHKVGSSNSDYEILNGRIADQNVIYYSYIKNYPDSVIARMAAAGYEPAVFHGLGGYLFTLREAYAAQGFSRFFFKEELLKAGYKPGALIMSHVMDADVFDMAAKQISRDGKSAQFIVTMSSHIPFMDPVPAFKSAGGTFARYVSSLQYVDSCLKDYYAALPEGTLLVLWGDHGSDVEYPRAFPDNGRHVPFIVHVKGDTRWMGKKALPRPANADPLTLCQLAHYLRRLVP